MDTLIDPAEIPAIAPPRRRANVLEGKEWLRNSVSVWRDIQKTPEEREFLKRMKKEGVVHPAMFPSALARRVVRTFVPAGPRWSRSVLDPFCGTGSTLVAAVDEGHVG